MRETQGSIIDRLASERFGAASLRPGQRAVIDSILRAAVDSAEGPRNRLVVLPTGGGKSLCFQLPSLLLGGPTLVVYPLLSLMADQARRLEEARIDHIVLRGGMESADADAARERLARGFRGVVIANPEILSVPEWRRAISVAGISHLVLDEAHTLVSWGREFRPAFLDLGAAADEAGVRIRSAFTATADPATEAGIAESFFSGQAYERIVAPPDRPNIRYEVMRCISRPAAIERLLQYESGAAIAFRSSRLGVETLAASLSRRFTDRDVFFYHAGLGREEKNAVEAAFRASPSGILVATCAYGMGVDKGDVRLVVHYDPPPSVEAYLQESGRAGRDGQRALAVLMLSGASFAEGRFRDGSALSVLCEERSRAIREYAFLEDGCRRDFLLGAMGWAESAQVRRAACCDACDGRRSDEVREEYPVMEWLSRNSRRYGRYDLGRVMASSDWSEGSMRPEDADEGVLSLEKSGKARLVKRGPWRGRLVPARSRPSVLEGRGFAGRALVAGLHAFGGLAARFLLPPPSEAEDSPS